MSRIHEALKKAAQERSERLASSVDSSVAMDTVELPRTLAAVETLQTAVQEPFAAPNTGTLRYEDVIQKCVTTKFRIDPRMSVFEGHSEANLGAERFRTLRSRLYQIASARTLRSVVVTSTEPGEGKTFVAANLAQSIVRQPERKVLLIDADLRASRLHLSFGAQRTPGLAEYLQGEADICSVIQKEEGANLCVIAGGREVSNPSELLLNGRLRGLLDRLTPLFDWVILDTPPTMPVHDASIIADVSDGVLFVVRAGVTDNEMASKAVEEFRDNNLVGVVLNRMERGLGYGGYYYYNYPDQAKD
jgi:protein-tyrosine kinase